MSVVSTVRVLYNTQETHIRILEINSYFVWGFTIQRVSTGSQVPECDGGAVLRVAGGRLLPADHGLQPLFLPGHRPLQSPGEH